MITEILSDCSLSDVIANWTSNSPTQTCQALYGLEYFWWLRITKLLQFLSGCSVVIDLLGKERLQKFYQQTIESAQLYANYVGSVHLAFSNMLAEPMDPSPNRYTGWSRIFHYMKTGQWLHKHTSEDRDQWFQDPSNCQRYDNYKTERQLWLKQTSALAIFRRGNISITNFLLTILISVSTWSWFQEMLETLMPVFLAHFLHQLSMLLLYLLIFLVLHLFLLAYMWSLIYIRLLFSLYIRLMVSFLGYHLAFFFILLLLSTMLELLLM